MSDVRLYHIVHIIPTLSFGGAERCVVDLVNHMDLSMRFSIITFSDQIPMAKEITRPNVEIIVLKQNKVTLARAIARELRRLAPDLVHTHLFGADVWGRISAKRAGIPVITTEHNINLAEGFLKTHIKRWLRNRSDVYVACSNAVREYMREAYRIQSDVTVIHYGIDLSRFLSIPQVTDKQHIKFAIIGRLTEQKGHLVAFQALSKLTTYPWSLSVIGSGELEDVLRRNAKDYAIADRVTFLPASHDVPHMLAAHDVLLMPSLWEGLGIIAMEAMAAGRVVIASDTGGIPELVSHDKTGLLVKAGESEALKIQIQRCFHDWKQCQTLAVAGRLHAQEQFGMKHMINAYTRLYWPFLSSRPKSRPSQDR